MRSSTHPFFSLITLAFLVFYTTTLSGQNYNMGDSPMVTDCSGFFLDSGGNASGYGPNEDLTFTICPDNTTGTHVQLVFSGVELADGDELCFFDGPDAAAPMISCASDFDAGSPFIIQATAVNTGGCLTITFSSDATDEGAGWSADMNCIPSCQTIQASLVSTMPEIMPIDTGWIDTCPGTRVFFTGTGIYPQDGLVYNHSDFTSEFEWDFGDGTFAVGPNVTHIYDEPGGYITQLTITDQFGCKNTNFISQRIRVSTPPDFNIGGNLAPEICAGDTIELNAVVDTILSEQVISVMPTEGSFQAGGIRSDSLPLPDGTGAVYSTTINITDFSPGQILSNINDLVSIGVNMEHSWMHDLRISLACPDGTVIILQQQEFISNEVFLGIPYEADDFGTPNPPGQGTGYNYNWTPGAPQTWTQYSNQFDPQILPEGDYAPFESFNNFLGCPLNGEWTIIVHDLWGSDNGWIFEWSINFNEALYPNLETFTPEIIDYSWQQNPSIFFETPDSIAAAPQNAGTASYTFEVDDNYGCTYDTTVYVDILPFTHPDCFSCSENLAEVNDTTICEGESVILDVASNISLVNDVMFEANPLYTFGFSNHPPVSPYESSISINSINPTVLSDPETQIVSICVDIQTDWNSDLSILVQAPSGEIIELSTNNGGGSDNYTNTCFTPTASNNITSGTGPFTGAFQPEGSWSDLNGAQINGEWTLLISDQFGPNDLGEIISWSITFQSTNEIVYSWDIADGLSCFDCPAPTATPLITTTYYIESQDSYGCSFGDSITVVVVSNIIAPDVTCEVGENNDITFNWTPVENYTQYEVNIIINGSPSGWQGPVPGFSYVVNNLDINDEVVLEVRAYVGNSVSCDIALGAATCVYDACTLNGSIQGGAPTDISCFGANDGSISVLANNGMTPFDFYLDGSLNSQNDGEFEDLTPGAHFVIIGDANACFDTIDFNIAEPDLLEVNITVDQVVSCHDGDNGTITAIPQGGNGSYEFEWSPASPNAPTLSSLSPGDYSVTVSDPLGCMNEAIVNLSNPDSISISFSVTNTTCSSSTDGEITAMASGGTGTLVYNWSNNVSGTNIINGLSVDTYCVTVMDGLGCSKIACIDVEAAEEIIIESFSVEEVDCNGNNTGSATVVASGGTGDLSYRWSDDLGQVSATAILLNADSYTVTITDQNNCFIVSEAIFIPEPEVLSVSATPANVLCKGGSDGTLTAFPAGGISPYNYNWSNNQSDSIANSLTVGTFFLTVTDNNGCEVVESFNIEEPENELTIDIAQSFQGCFGTDDNEATVIANGGTGTNYTYQWSDGNAQTNATAIDLASNSYSVTVMDENACETSASIELVDLERIWSAIIFNEPSCYGFADGQLGINDFGGGAGEDDNEDDYTFEWSTGETAVAIVGLLGDQTYFVTITDMQGCNQDTSFNLGQPSEITFDTEVSDVRCFNGTDGTATVSNIQGDFPNYEFLWDNNANSQTDATADSLAPGSYSVTVTDNTGCFQTQTVSLEAPDAIVIDFKTIDNLCFGEGKGSATALVDGGVPGYSYNWSNSRSESTVENLFADNYSLTVTDLNGCEQIAAIEIFQPDAMTAEVAPEDVTCYGDRNGKIHIDPLGGTPPYAYSLNNNDYFGSGTLIGLTAGNYTVYIKDQNGCLLIEKVDVVEPPEFLVNAGQESYTIYLRDTLSFAAESTNEVGQVEFIWSAPYDSTLSCNECTYPRAWPDYTITYELYGIDSRGCEATDMVTVYVKKPRVVEVPTGFSPNGDGLHDLLLVHGQNGSKVKLFQVFDRWGEQLYENRDFMINDITQGWDGSFRGEMVNSGVYVWYVIVEYVDGVEEVFKGQTTVIR